MKRIQCFLVLLLMMSNAAIASEHPACRNYTQTYINYNASDLRTIAASCQKKEIARLFYNRAYHQNLLSEGKALSGIIRQNQESSDYQLTAYRLYIALVEELAPLYYPDLKQRIEFLNTVYERRSEVVELRLRGNDRLADALERKILF